MKVQLIQWVRKGSEFPCQVVMPDASATEGFAESACKKLKPDTIIQFERFGFTRVDEVKQNMVAYYAHK
jgi:glutamyl-tRNA synthetase